MNGVTLASLTEFGRTTRENGSGGTDHGYGQAVMLLGGGVKGGQVHGDWPGLDEDDDLTPTTDYRNLLAEILEKRCGASSANINDIFPGITNDRLEHRQPAGLASSPGASGRRSWQTCPVDDEELLDPSRSRP